MTMQSLGHFEGTFENPSGEKFELSTSPIGSAGFIDDNAWL